MSSFKDVLKMALAGKNKQAHRVVAGSKKAKQLMAQHNGNNLGQVDARDIRRDAKGINSKRDI